MVVNQVCDTHTTYAKLIAVVVSGALVSAGPHHAPPVQEMEPLW